MTAVLSPDKRAFRFRALYDGVGGCIQKGILAVDGGRIAAVGAEGSIALDCAVEDCSRFVCIPGLVDAHSHLAVYKDCLGEAGNDYMEWKEQDFSSRPLDAFDGFDPGIGRALASGITTVCVTPGSNQVLNGFGEVFKLRGREPAAMLLRPHALFKAALGENPVMGNRAGKRYPSTRMGGAAVLRSALGKILTSAKEAGGGTDAGIPELSARLRSGATRLCIHAHAPADILTGLRIAEEFGIKPVLLHATGICRALESIRPEAADFILGPFLYGNWKPELADLSPHTMARLQQAGFTFAVSSDHPFTPCEFLRGTVILAQGFGLDIGFGLRTLTRFPAGILGVSDRVGSLEAGKDADFVILTDEPGSACGRVVKTFIDGQLVYEAAEL